MPIFELVIIVLLSMALGKIAAVICLLSISGYTVTAQKKAAGSGVRYATVAEASYQRTIPGVKDGEITTEYRIVLVWKSRLKPRSFFWYSDQGGWMGTEVRKITNGTAEALNLGAVAKGDTLEIIPVPGGKYAIPVAITKSRNNHLFFSTTPGQWLYLPVKKMKRLEDLIMP